MMWSIEGHTSVLTPPILAPTLPTAHDSPLWLTGLERAFQSLWSLCHCPAELEAPKISWAKAFRAKNKYSPDLARPFEIRRRAITATSSYV